ncbi:MAG: hypothetical protein ACRENB_03985 [Gemmatimonadales bacterium]
MPLAQIQESYVPQSEGSAVQAISGVIVAIATVVLAVLTGRYVKLTRAIAVAASAQTKALELAEGRRTLAASMALRALAVRVLAILNSLSPDTIHESEVRRFSGLAHGDIAELEHLARDVGPEAQSRVAVTAIGLLWVIGFVSRYQATDPGYGYSISAEELQAYRSAIPASQSELEALIHELSTAPASWVQLAVVVLPSTSGITSICS